MFNSIISSKKLTITTLLGVVILGTYGGVFAADQCGGQAVIDEGGTFVFLTSLFVQVMSWGWTIIAAIAGELMSNDLIYGRVVGLEHYFYEMRSFMRTVANVSLVGIIISLISKNAFNGNIKKILTDHGINIIIAGICINMSWFAMGALVDISTIMIAGVGKIGFSFIDTNKLVVAQSIPLQIPDKITVDHCGCVSATNTQTNGKTYQNLIDNADSITGPLIFLGAGVLKLQGQGVNATCNASNFGDLGSLTIRTLIGFVTMMLFVTPLSVLAIYNLFRLIYIWACIVFGPLLVLFNLFQGQLGFLGVSEKYVKMFGISNIITSLLQPVFTSMALVVGLMLVLSMYQIFGINNNTSGSQSLRGVYNSKSFSKLYIGSDTQNLGSISLIDSLANDPGGTIGGGFGYLLIVIAVSMVLWMMVKMSFSFSKEGAASLMPVDAVAMMDKIRGEFMKRVTLPNIGGPLGGASLQEAANFFDPGDKGNRVMSRIEKYAGGMNKNSVNAASDGLEKSWLGSALGMQNNGDLREDEVKKYPVEKADISSGDYQSIISRPIQGLVASAKDQESKKTFKVDRSGRKSYGVLEDWYNKIGKAAIESMGIKIDTVDKDGKASKESLKLGSFKEEFDKSESYVVPLIKALAKGDKLKIKDGKVEALKGKGGKISDIDFKSF